ncbi:hypothetical protein FF124_13070 [Martelella lutilitoris]|uniref:Uncharacterized protein n=1 Tax=Martelella lutilitoris TaxID=2583532 RepID=A0A5C4JP43_9HYPH|nr:hypothetical protein [Martelella lutilitoris]TNB47108.1 hypothetical protein FF124_13070 [Martelella lutilitoris]
MADDGEDQNTGAKRAWWRRISARLPSFRQVAKGLGLLAVAVFVFLAVVSVYNSSQAVDDYIPRSWNAAIEKLGIVPLYPPQEDVYVGDVFLAVEPSTQQFKKLPNNLRDEAMMGRSVKIGHIDLSSHMDRPDDTRYFGDTKLEKDGTLSMTQPRVAVVPDPLEAGRVALSNLVFPAISLNHGASASGLLGALGLSAAGGSATKIVLSHVQAYGANPYAALVKLDMFCKDDLTRGFCIEEIARAHLAYMVGDDILKTAVLKTGGKDYIFEIRIFIVYRAYLTRSLQVGRADGAETGLFSAVPERKDDDQAPLDMTIEQPEAQNDGSQVATIAVSAANNTSAVEAGRGSKRNYWVNEKFIRPLVFGYRSVSMKMR